MYWVVLVIYRKALIIYRLAIVTFHGKTNNDFPCNGFYKRLSHEFQTGEEFVLNN